MTLIGLNERLVLLRSKYLIKDEKIKTSWTGATSSEFFKTNKKVITNLINEHPKYELENNVNILAGLSHKDEIPLLKEFYQARILADVLKSPVTLLPRNANHFFSRFFGVTLTKGSMTDGIAILANGQYFSEFKRIRIKNFNKETRDAFKSDLPFIALHKAFFRNKDEEFAFFDRKNSLNNTENKPCLFLNLETARFFGKKLRPFQASFWLPGDQPGSCENAEISVPAPPFKEYYPDASVVNIKALKEVDNDTLLTQKFPHLFNVFVWTEEKDLKKGR